MNTAIAVSRVTERLAYAVLFGVFGGIPLAQPRGPDNVWLRFYTPNQFSFAKLFPICEDIF